MCVYFKILSIFKANLVMVSKMKTRNRINNQEDSPCQEESWAYDLWPLSCCDSQGRIIKIGNDLEVSSDVVTLVIWVRRLIQPLHILRSLRVKTLSTKDIGMPKQCLRLVIQTSMQDSTVIDLSLNHVIVWTVNCVLTLSEEYTHKAAVQWSRTDLKKKWS